MPIQRLFFDWSRPALSVAAGYLWERYQAQGTFDLDRVIVAVPGARPGRHLLQRLVELAEEHGAVLVPPRIVTAGKLPELLYEAKKPFASDMVQQLAWSTALRDSPPAEVESLVKQLPESRDLTSWLALGQMFAQLHRELTAEGLDFEHVIGRGATIEGFIETERWQALAALERRYLRTLDALDLWDIQTARLIAIERRECTTDCDIVLLATVDMDRTQRKMLDQVADRVTALVFAPSALENHFDGHGCLISKAWREMPVAVTREQIEIVDGPADQADATIRAIASWNGQFAAEEISIGVPDQRVVPYLIERLEEAEIAARFGAGKILAQSAPVQLLKAVTAFLEEASYAALAALVRHPDLDLWLRRRGIAEDYLTALDNYYSRHFPSHRADTWLGESQESDCLRRMSRAVNELTEPLIGSPRPLGQWTEPIVALLTDVYGPRELTAEAESDRTLVAACKEITLCLDELRNIDRSLAPQTTGSEALRLVLGRISSLRVPPRAEAETVELLGWLELPLDEAAALVITGLNEGIVPASLNGDLFLPDRLRKVLELEDNDRRYARDNYALNLLAASRTKLRLIAGRRTAEGDPLVPSRLLFACDDAELSQRAREFFGPMARSAHLVFAKSLQPGKGRSELPIPRPLKLPQPTTALKVTEFRDYLACPYRYYLRHRLKLEALEDSAEELEPSQFGTLVHRVFKQFAESPLADCTNAEKLAAGLGAILDEVLLEQFGENVLAAVRIQAEQIRLRLAAFAQWQAGWRSEGWRIRFSECDITNNDKACLVVDGTSIRLHGRIDRIDVNERDGRTVIFDYKTSDSPKTPDKSHREKDQWVDLQLPLYRHLARGLGIEGPVQLGYIVLPKDTSKTTALIAEWTENELNEADEVAFDVIRDILAEKFWPPSPDPVRFCEDLAAICQDNLFAAAGLGADEPENGES